MSLLTSPNCSYSTSQWPSIGSACSGHGICVQDICVCDGGYTGYNDLLNQNGLDCQIHLPVVIAIWAFNFFIVFFRVYVEIYFYVKAFQRTKATMQKNYQETIMALAPTPLLRTQLQKHGLTNAQRHGHEIHVQTMLPPAVRSANNTNSVYKHNQVLPLSSPPAANSPVLASHSLSNSYSDCKSHATVRSSSETAGEIETKYGPEAIAAAPASPLLRPLSIQLTAREKEDKGAGSECYEIPRFLSKNILSSSTSSLASSPPSPSPLSPQSRYSATPIVSTASAPFTAHSTSISRSNADSDSLHCSAYFSCCQSDNATASVSPFTNSQSESPRLQAASSVVMRQVSCTEVLRKMFSGLMSDNAGRNFKMYRIFSIIHSFIALSHCLLRIFGLWHDSSLMTSSSLVITIIDVVGHDIFFLLQYFSAEAMIGVALQAALEYMNSDGASMESEEYKKNREEYEMLRQQRSKIARLAKSFRFLHIVANVIRVTLVFVMLAPFFVTNSQRTLDLYVAASVIYHCAILAGTLCMAFNYLIPGRQVVVVLQWVHFSADATPAKKKVVQHLIQRTKKLFDATLACAIFTIVIEGVAVGWSVVRRHEAYIRASIDVLVELILLQYILERNNIELFAPKPAQQLDSANGKPSDKAATVAE